MEWNIRTIFSGTSTKITISITDFDENRLISKLSSTVKVLNTFIEQTTVQVECISSGPYVEIIYVDIVLGLQFLWCIWKIRK